jgi:peptidoglycan/LPS O-acetylase OafA/YrhL
MKATERRAPQLSPGPSRLGYRPCLDGLRGVAILAVIVVHTRLPNIRAAFVGVELFFVLSGFLITCLLLEEWDKAGSISLRRFYLRRALRLLPALAVLLLFVTCYYWLFMPGTETVTTATDAVIALFYSTNWALGLHLRELGVFAHTWSLSIEEQFYLCWPLALIWWLRRGNSRSSLLNSVLLQVLLSSNFARVFYGTDSRADALLLGCAVAVLFSSPSLSTNARLRRITAWGAWASAIGLIFLACVNLDLDYATEVCGVYFLIPLLAAVLLMHLALVQSGPLHYLLSNRCLVFVGKISYGLYLWHYPIFGLVQARELPVATELAVELVLTAVAVLASYYLLELPALKLKTKFGAPTETVPDKTGGPALPRPDR